MAHTIYESVERLLQYGKQKTLIYEYDTEYCRNQLYDVLGLQGEEVMPPPYEEELTPVSILTSILDWAGENKLLEDNTTTYKDLLDTKLMGCLVGRPSEIINHFKNLYHEKGPMEAMSWYYRFSKDSHYIRTDRIAKNEHWYSSTEYGDLEITINLSKPEKDPKEIAAEKKLKASSYPKCLLCKENEGYAGRINHPARQNLRVIPIELNGQSWNIQFSPYVYYNEHAIVFSSDHRPMVIEKEGFDRLLDFVEQFPHYFIGSNADLPIVGGSILSHDHFQAGNHDFPMAKAEFTHTFTNSKFPSVKGGIVRWPMSVVRLQSLDRQELSTFAGEILDKWRGYSDEEVGIFSHTDEVPHNTITPIARRRGDLFELDLVLRNNRTNDEHPLGIFHPHDEVHHIKKENIGLIEVMGLAVLPGRLKEEMTVLGQYLLDDKFKEKTQEDPRTSKHYVWAQKIKENYSDLTEENVSSNLQQEIGKVFSIVLEHAGVFKQNKQGQKAFQKFLEYLN